MDNGKKPGYGANKYDMALGSLFIEFRIKIMHMEILQSIFSLVQSLDFKKSLDLALKNYSHCSGIDL